MTETIVASNTTDAAALATASLTRTNGTPAHQDGTLVEIGGGVFLTAGHVLYQYASPGAVRTADSYTLHVSEGLDAPRDVSVLSADFATTFYNPSWGTVGGSDMAFALTGSTASVDLPMIVYADAGDAAGTLTTFGYPVAGGYDGATMVQVTGTLSADSDTTVTTSDGDMSVLVSDTGMQVYSGFSGAGVWLTNDIDGDGAQERYLAGVVSLDVQYGGGVHATGFEPMADIYAQLGAALAAGAASADDFARATLVSGQAVASAHTTVTGTLLHEDLIGGVNNDTLDGGGGADSLFGGDGADTLSGGDGDDALFGGNGADELSSGMGKDRMTGGAGADLFIVTTGARTGSVLDFEKGTDRVDISDWGVTQLSDLTIQDHHSGRVVLRHGKDALVLDDGSRGLTAASFGDSDFIYAPGGAPIPDVVGTAGNDKLLGTTEGEVLSDGAGRDRMFGLGGADTFVLSADGALDQVKDFQIGADRMDVSAWGVTAFDELTLRPGNNGKVTIIHGNELLVVSDAARTLEAGDLSASDFIFV